MSSNARTVAAPRVEEQVMRVVAEITGSPKARLTPASSMDNTRGWDSLAHIRIVCKIEEMIGRQLTLDEIVTAVTIKDWVRLVQQAHRRNGR